ncbi:hypothetical protein BS78_08G097600 [Paspalum vaginatum]|nr:hypothetical protein BS78_08G097600 [Paspalum vaginatum]
MSNPSTIVLGLKAEAPPANTSQPSATDAVDRIDDAPTLEKPEDVVPRRNLRRRRGRAGDRFGSTMPNFSLTLTEDEIAEDIYSLTGELPRSHPRRRPVPLQKMLDRYVPGGPLAGLTPETYPQRQKDH